LRHLRDKGTVLYWLITIYPSLCGISSGGRKMNDLMLKMYVAYKNVMAREEGQDLVEYALVVALIAFGAVAGMNALAGGINTAFQDVSSSLLKNI
jgi:pilus assembly protein Flp/PilA